MLDPKLLLALASGLLLIFNGFFGGEFAGLSAKSFTAKAPVTPVGGEETEETRDLQDSDASEALEAPQASGT